VFSRHRGIVIALATGLVALLGMSAESFAAGPAAPVATSPCGGVTLDQIGAFRWNASTGATHYQFRVSADAGFQTPAYGTGSGPNLVTTNNTKATLPNTLATGTYFWDVRALNASNAASAWSTSCTFDMDWTDAPPLSTPDDGATVTYPTPLLMSWGAVTGAARYSVNVSESSDMSSPLTGYPVTTTATSYSPPSRLSNGTYYWQVTPIDGDSAKHQGAASEIRSFTWDWPSSQTTLSVTDLDPSDAVYDPQFSWTPIPGADNYQLEINDDQNFSKTKVCCSDTIISTTYTPTKLLPADTYYWRVRAVDPNGNFGPWVVSPSTFTVAYDVAGVSDLTMDDTSGNPIWTSSPLSTDTPIVTWDPAPGAQSYGVDVVPYTSGVCQWGALTTVGWHSKTASTAWTPLGNGLTATNPFPNSGHNTPSTDQTTLSPGTSYCVRVRAQRASDSNAQQVVGAYTYLGGDGNPAFTFTGYPSGNPCTVPCNSSLNIGAGDYILPAQTGNTRLPLFTWKPIAGVQSYFVIVATDNTFQHVIDEAFTHVDAYAPRGGSGLINYPNTNTGYAWAVLPAQGFDGSSAGDDPTPNGSYPQTFDFHSVQPSPLAPLTGATVTSQPTFSWTPVEAADHYVLQVSSDPSFGTMVGGTPVQTTATSYTGTNFPAGNLYWRVQAVDASGNGLSWTDPQQFTMSYAAPTFTGNGTSYVNPATADAIPVLHWDSMPGATSYELKIYNGTTTPTLDVQNISSTAYAPTTLKGTGGFTWTVYARYPTSGADVSSPVSATQSFTRSIAAPDGLTGGTTNQHSVLLSWNPKAGAASYAVQISTENTFTTGVFDSYASGNRPESAVLAPLLTANQYTEGGNLFWRIATVDGDGNQGAWSLPQPLTMPQRIHASASPIAIQHAKTTTVTITAKTLAGAMIKGVKVTDKGAGVTAAAKVATSGSVTFKVHPTKKGTITFTLSKTGCITTTLTVSSL